jgi:hypothetical protein
MLFKRVSYESKSTHHQKNCCYRYYNLWSFRISSAVAHITDLQQFGCFIPPSKDQANKGSEYHWLVSYYQTDFESCISETKIIPPCHLNFSLTECSIRLMSLTRYCPAPFPFISRCVSEWYAFNPRHEVQYYYSKGTRTGMPGQKVQMNMPV